MRFNRFVVSALAAVLGLAVSGKLMAQNHDRFNDQDRSAVQKYYDAHKDHPPAGWRQQDRLNADMERHLVAGEVLSADLRTHEHAVPHDLIVQLGPVPRGDRYVIIGGHVCMIDHENHIVDVLSVTF